VAGCPDPSLLDAFCRGTLEPAARSGVEHHLDACADCASTVAQLVHMYGSSWAPAAASLADHSHLTAADPAAPPPTDTRYAGIDPSRPDAAPVRVGRYQLGRRLGSGGMGMVFEAHDPELHRLVAIKLLHPGVTEDADGTRARLLREARAMARLAHPHVVAVHDVGGVGEQVFIAMELVRGTTLGQWLATAPRTMREILAVFVQAGRGLEAAHAVGLVHRDFKPDNVLIGDDGRPRVTDFGLARPSTAWPAAEAGPGTSLHGTGTTTAAGAIVGTPAYMAPEQWRGATADARSDQFAFCVALYEALFRERPFAGDSLHALADNVTQGRMKPVPRSAPAWLRAAIVRGLSIDPRARHPSMSALLQVIARDDRRTARVGAIVGAMAIGAVGTAGVLGWMSDSTAPVAAAADEAASSAGESGATDVAEPGPAPEADADAPAVDVEVCRERARTADSRWTTERRNALQDRIAKMEHAAAIAERTIPALDAWVAEHARQAEAECDPAALPSHAPHASHAEARRTCRAEALARFDALVRSALELETFKVEGSLAGAVRRLPAVERCDDEPWLAAWPKSDPAKLAQARLLRSELASVEAEAALEQLVSAPQAAEDLAARAEALGEPVVSAEVMLATGLVAAQRRQHELAVSWLERAAVAAESAGHDAVLVQAAIALAEERGVEELRPSDGDGWLRTAAGPADRLADPRLFAAFARAKGRLLHARGELLGAKEELEHALAQSHLAYGDAHPAVAEVHLLLAGVLFDLEHAAAKEHAVAARDMFAATVGPADLDLARAGAMLARVLLPAGELAAAEDAARSAVKIVAVSSSLRHDYDRGRWILVLADVLAARGSDADAIAEYDRAPIYLYDGPPHAEPALAKGAFFVARGRTDEGITAIASALAELETHWGADDPRLVAPLWALGRAQKAAGKEADARATLRRAMDIAAATFGYGPFHARAQIELGDLERAFGHDAQALALYDDAHVPLTGAYGLDHAVVTRRVLDRADLAFGLGQTEYAGRLYGSVHDRLSAQLGAADPATRRAAERRGSE
jgi:tetratricopeptide (TPR) repeat protein